MTRSPPQCLGTESWEGCFGNFIIPFCEGSPGSIRKSEKHCWATRTRREHSRKNKIRRRIPDDESEIGMLPCAVIPARTRLVATFAIFVFFIVFADSTTNDSQVKCSRTCVAENCNSVGIRYGKYCGVGWSGCPGEKPCDDLDACCKIHDECVDKKGLINVKCHEKFKRCIKKVQKSGKVGFSRNCPIQMAVPTMMQGMDMAILFSRLGSAQHDEL